MIARIWIAVVVLLLAAAEANAMPIDLPGGPDVADVINDEIPIVSIAEPVAAHVRVTQTVLFVEEVMPASAFREDVFRPPRLSND